LMRPSCVSPFTRFALTKKPFASSPFVLRVRGTHPLAFVASHYGLISRGVR
jgi:hypothetical protein